MLKKKLYSIIETRLLYSVKIILNFIIYFYKSVKFFAIYRFIPPPKGTDFIGYEMFFKIIEDYKLLYIDGDIVEIGAFLGGGTYKLAKYLERKKSPKKVYVIDIFDVYSDQTVCTKGIRMADMYEKILNKIGKGISQLEVFQKITKKCKNMILLIGDSKNIEIPTNSICFAFIDGNHEPSYVRNDFYLVWQKLSPEGIVAFDDYAHDLPGVTRTINELIGEFSEKISIILRQDKVIFLKKTN